MSVDFLAAVARVALTGSNERLQWPRGVDVIAEAQRHGLLGQLDRVAIEHMPETERARLRETSQQWTRRALVMAAQLRTLLDVLRAADIDVLPVKGPVLAAFAYGHSAARSAVGDLDLVVRPRDFNRAAEAIVASGYRRIEWHLDEHDSHDQEAHLFLDGEGAMVELHTAMAGDLDDIFARSENRQFLGSTIRVASAEDTLLHLCVHGSQHMWSRLQWVCDVAAHIRANPGLDFALVMERATAIRTQRRLALGLHLAKALLGVGPGGEVPNWLVRLAHRRMKTADPSRLMIFFYDFAQRETAAERRSCVVYYIKPNALDRARVKLPRPLSWFYFVVRTVRVLTK